MSDTVSQGCGHPSGGHGDEDMERSGPPEGWPLAGKHVACTVIIMNDFLTGKTSLNIPFLSLNYIGSSHNITFDGEIFCHVA
jgi:hypothetical protein